MRIVCWLALAGLVGGCSTGLHHDGQGGSPAVISGHTDPSAAFVNPALMANQPEDGDNERPRGEEVRRHSEVPQRHEGDSNYHPPRDFSGFYAGCATPQLKAITLRHGELLWKKYEVRNLRMRSATHTELADPVGQELFEELMEAKRELWRRWKAGEFAAYLPEFERE